MINFKTTAMAVLTLSSSAIFAGTMGPVCMAGKVSVPCASTAWDIGVHALYLKPGYSDELAWVGFNSHKVESVLPGGLGGILSSVETDNYVQNDPAWNWGFELEASYHFNTGNDLNLNWYHLGQKTNTNHTVAVLISPDDVVDTPTNISSTVSSKPTWDAVNLEFGQHVDFGIRKKIRFHGGAQFARIKTESSALIVSTENGFFPGLGTEQIATSASYNGFGPRLGADMSYQLDNGFAMFANGAVAVLAGKTKFAISDISAQNFTGDFDDPSTSSDSKTGNKTSFVPELEAKLGLKYSHSLTHGDLTLDAGYMWVNYFSAITVQTEDSNFGLQGPFVGLKWLGNV